MKQALAWLGLGAFLWLGGGCGRADDGGAIALEDYASRSAQVGCESLGACCKQQGFGFDAARCRSLLTTQVQQAIDAQASDVVYDAQAAGECLAHAGGGSCGDNPGGADPACSRIFVEKLAPPGAACASEFDCEDPVGGIASCDGVCRIGAPAGHGKLGEGCSFTCVAGDSCFGNPGDPPAVGCYRNEGLYCSEAGPQPICQPLVAIGQPCEIGYGCAGENTFCSFIDATCSAPRASGAACGADWECQSGFCDGSQVCRSPSVNPNYCAPP